MLGHGGAELVLKHGGEGLGGPEGEVGGSGEDGHRAGRGNYPDVNGATRLETGCVPHENGEGVIAQFVEVDGGVLGEVGAVGAEKGRIGSRRGIGGPGVGQGGLPAVVGGPHGKREGVSRQQSPVDEAVIGETQGGGGSCRGDGGGCIDGRGASQHHEVVDIPARTGGARVAGQDPANPEITTRILAWRVDGDDRFHESRGRSGPSFFQVEITRAGGNGAVVGDAGEAFVRVGGFHGEPGGTPVVGELETSPVPAGLEIVGMPEADLQVGGSGGDRIGRRGQISRRAAGWPRGEVSLGG